MAPRSKGTSSPSTSSVFLPLGRRTRRDSKASLSPDLDQEALNEALDNIHSAASASQVLTVFNEYTDPPSSASKNENRTLATDLSGGLTGLYTKLKATVGGSKDNEPREVSAPTPLSQDNVFSKTSSNKTSVAMSPRMLAHEIPGSPEFQPQPSKLSSKATSVSRMSVNFPTVKSPTGPPPPAYVDPALTNMNIYADKTHSVAHSRTGSGYDWLPGTPRSAGTDVVSTQSVRTDDFGPELSSHPQRTKSSMSASNAGPASSLPNGHVRQGSTTSADVRILAPPAAPIVVQENGLSTRPMSGRQERASLNPQRPSPLQLLGTHATAARTPVIVHPAISKEDSRSARMNPRELPHPKLAQSRLPGYSGSQASSTDSGPTMSLSRLNGHERVIPLDGTPENPDSNQLSRPAKKLRSRLLNREYWMRDENARDCFHCGEPFTTFRRKHHCRTCGQIFDSKCTVLLNGNHFGLITTVRVCTPCQAIIISHEDDSSDYSDVDSINLPESLTRPRTPDTGHLLRSTQPLDDDTASVISLSLEQMAKTPTMSLPVRRAYEGEGLSKVLEFESMDRGLPRPSSSRSLKHSHSLGHGHKRHHSRQQLVRSYKAYHDERAPFQRRTIEDVSKDAKPSAFHTDSVIDPEMAQYLSDDGSSADEQSVTGQEKLSRSAGDGERTAISGLLAAVRKGRSRLGDRSIAGLLNLSRDADEVSLVSTRERDLLRPSRRRNLSVASSLHQRATPRTTKERLHLALTGGADDSPLTPVQPEPFSRVSRMIRSASMHGMGAPAMELNRASIQHVHKLLQQLLRDADVPKIASWEDALVPILLRATDDVDPDVQGGDDIDIRNYVKLKKVSGGRPGDTSYISGVIFTKNVALKSMSRLIMSPRILIITFAVEYARHEQHFMSLDPVIRQEREYLENLVGRIATLKPDLLLAQKNVSGLALELLEKARISTVFHVKPSVLDAVSRCTQTRVVQTMDKLGTQSGQLGTCESFEVKTFVSEGRKKTYIYLSGCPPQLGCTIAIRGSDRKILSRIKRITDFMIYVVYNLKLETCLMRDEWAMIPTLTTEEGQKHSANVSTVGSSQARLNEAQEPQLDTAIDTKVAEADASALDVAPAAEAGDKSAASSSSITFESPESAEIPDDVPVPTFYEDMVDKHQTRILSASPFVKFMQPYLLMKARELERRVAYLKRLRDQDMSASQSLDEKTKIQKFTLIQPDMLHAPLGGASKKGREIIHAVLDAEYDKALHNYETQKRQWETYLSGNRNLFDPYAHQNIVVLFSHVATETSVPCQGPDVLAFNFYSEQDQQDFEADCTLGQYVEDLCLGANELCGSTSCEKRMHEHHRQYVHGEAQISVFVQLYPAKMRGLQDVILMWSQCKICGLETTVTPMSASTWKYSFGKYLELSFWSADLHARAGMCPHDLHRDHLRYFGYKDVALRIHYDPIDLLEIIVPRMRITWKVDNDLRFRNEVFTRIEHRITRFMGSVKLRLKSINAEAILPENADACREEIERLTKKANDDHTALIKQLQERYSNSRHWEIIPLNRAVRATQEKVAEWDAVFTEFEQNFFPSEKDIRRLATLQLKKIFLDRDVSVTSFTSDHEGTTTPPVEEVIDEKDDILSGEERPPMRKRTTTLSPEKTQNVLQAVLEEHTSPPQVANQIGTIMMTEKPATELLNVHSGIIDTADIKHLDLAIPSSDVSGSAVVGSSDSELPSLQRTESEQSQLDDPMTPRADKGGDPLSDSFATPRASNVRVTIPLPLQQHTRNATPPLIRSHSTPAETAFPKKDAPADPRTPSVVTAVGGLGISHDRAGRTTVPSEHEGGRPEKKLSERFGLSQLKKKGHSFIPRAITSKKDSRVSNLAKHFEQLSREFERERVRERRVRAARSRQARGLSSCRPKANRGSIQER